MAEVEYVGPFEDWQVVVDGWRVSHLSAVPLTNGRVRLILDQRLAVVLDVATAEDVVPFVADAIAIASGYSCHPRQDWEGPKPLKPFRRSHGLLTLPGPDQC
jgi:hypothetical protein